MKSMDTNGDTGSALPPWEGRAILLVDLDAFFASVEQLDHPEWRGKPVIVGGDADKRGVVSTASYEARAFGVHSAMASATAKRLCPDAIWTHGHFDRYNTLSAAVMDILFDESPLLQQVSIDEAFLDVTPGRFNREHPVAIATRIQERVAELGITCSVGVGTSKTVAKIASDIDKPRGITVVYPGSEESFLAPLPAGCMSGIGKKSQEKLHDFGIDTLGDLAAADPSVMKTVFGVNTASVLERARGIDPVEVETEREVKSVSNEMTFSVDITERAELVEAVKMLSAKVGRRLRRKGFKGRTVTLKMRYDDLSRRTSSKTLPAATDDENEFSGILVSLIDELWQPGVRIRLVGVGVGGFDERAEQMGLFDEVEESGERGPDKQERRQLIEATDKVKNRFGDGAVSYGRELRFKEKNTGTAPQKKDETD